MAKAPKRPSKGKRGKTGRIQELQAGRKAKGLQLADGLDYTLIGHQHSDHLGGLDEVIQAAATTSGWPTGTTAGLPRSFPLDDTRCERCPGD